MKLLTEYTDGTRQVDIADEDYIDNIFRRLTDICSVDNYLER